MFRINLAFVLVNIDSFFDLLRENNGAVIGSVALKLVMNGCSTSWNPRDLNIGTPRNGLSVFSEWLRRIDYKFSGTGVLRREVAGALTHTIYVNGEGRAVTVTETKETDSFLGAIVGASHTATMNFITSEHVRSLYPAETLKNRFSYAYRTPLSPSQKSALLRRGFVLVTESNGHPAGRHVCPDTHRQLAGFVGIGLFEWKSGGPTSNFLTRSYTWRLGDSCANPVCTAERMSRHLVRRDSFCRDNSEIGEDED